MVLFVDSLSSCSLRLVFLFIFRSDCSFIVHVFDLFFCLGLGLTCFLPSLIDAIMMLQKVANFDRLVGSSLVKRVSMVSVLGCFKNFSLM